MSSEADVRIRRIAWISIAGLGLVALALATFSVEWVEESVDLGYGPQARRNPLFAAERYLEARSIDVESVAGFGLLDDLPPPGDVLFMTSSRRALSERRTAALEDWVHAGGHLVVVAEEPYGNAERNPDPLLDAFGLYLEECQAVSEEQDAGSQAEDLAGDEPEEVQATGDEAPEENVRLGELLREGLSGDLPLCWPEESPRTLVGGELGLGAEVELDSCRRIRSYGDSDESAEIVPRYQIYSAAQGAGSFTAATSLSILTNRRIHCADHAYLLEALSRKGNKTWLLADPDVPNLASLVWEAVPLVCMSSLIWLIVWAASRSLAAGQRVDSNPPARRELLEHLEASAHFLWRKGLIGESLDALREDVARRAGRHCPDFERLDRAERARALADITRLSESHIDFALVADPASKRSEFTGIMRTLQSIRRHL